MRPWIVVGVVLLVGGTAASLAGWWILSTSSSSVEPLAPHASLATPAATSEVELAAVVGGAEAPVDTSGHSPAEGRGSSSVQSEDHVLLRVVVKATPGHVLQDPVVEWSGLAPECRDSSAVIEAPGGLAVLSIPRACRRVRVAAFAEGLVPNYVDVTGLAAMRRANPQAVGGAHGEVEVTLGAGAGSSTGFSGTILVDGKRECPAELTVTMHPVGRARDMGPRPSEYGVLVDRRRSEFHALGRLPDEFVLEASSPSTVTLDTEPLVARPGLRRDLRLATEVGLDVRLRRLGIAVAGARVILTYSQESPTPVEGMPDARSFSRHAREAATDATGRAVLRGIPPGVRARLEVHEGAQGIPVAAREFAVAASPSLQLVEFVLGSTLERIRVEGTTDVQVPNPAGDCTVVMSAYDSPLELARTPVVDGRWSFETDQHGRVRLWVECGGSRLSSVGSRTIQDAAPTEPLHLPLLLTHPVSVLWTNAPLGWTCRWSQSGRILQENRLAEREAKIVLSVEPREPLRMELQSAEGGRAWIEVQPSTGPLIIDFRAGESVVRRVSWPAGDPSHLLDPLDLDGQLVFEALRRPEGVLTFRVALPIKDGSGSSPFDLRDEPWFYIFESNCVPGLMAGVLPGGIVAAAPHALGRDCAWLETDVGVTARGAFQLQSAGGFDLRALVPEEMLESRAGTGDCSSAQRARGWVVLPGGDAILKQGR